MPIVVGAGARIEQVESMLAERNQTLAARQQEIGEVQRAQDQSRQRVMRLLGELSSLRNQVGKIEEFQAGTTRHAARVEEEEAQAASGIRPQYEIRPSAEELLDELLPASVRMRLFQAFLDATVSEQMFRMAAMKAATEAAEEMIGDLTREYNRARQSAITTELLDIVGGAAALE